MVIMVSITIWLTMVKLPQFTGKLWLNITVVDDMVNYTEVN